MKRRFTITIAGVLAIILLLSLALPAYAKAARTKVTFFEYDCANEMEAQWTTGQILHIQNYKHTNQAVSDIPELSGINTTFADAEINMKNGNMTIRGTMSFQPDSINGTWEGHWTFISNNGKNQGWSLAHGTGELAGKTLFLNLYDGDPTDDDQAMCEGLGDWEGNSVAKGYILDSGSH